MRLLTIATVLFVTYFQLEFFS
ncbi:hypothetical protein Bhyg_04211 [Pseudolycoriella hygida]|uniref:Uncharacterized protein n=1 Tax=Pseudolycoriella hygida TaxID=35572 RepID=A0A9Q0NGB9_9DIPT|nr:hypothetical protein Bhyg_04210 [Pseudolycoriella hygida]KAJ6648979.1 hypothetical protein Bhyg_04211 [Pseudolycoriella hygida]